MQPYKRINITLTTLRMTSARQRAEAQFADLMEGKMTFVDGMTTSMQPLPQLVNKAREVLVVTKGGNKRPSVTRLHTNGRGHVISER